MDVTTYRIEVVQNQFAVIDSDGETVNVFDTEEQAEKEKERCEREDLAWMTAKTLMDVALKAHMEMCGMDAEASAYWLKSASETIP